ncbi:hypothetical protein NHH03_15110 [Stieleria sp. TO1_6]|uniref:hypothetical protein n=1 Tax=Stieleria tagensis TaxID=2956795 RepID=UPI00209B4DC3|nr:hypothetical protein [Stieleria tagensis]MCO8123075.1 hypothetical protein [Stieleria tagensis]
MPDTRHGDRLDAIFGQRHTLHVEKHPAPCSVVSLAKEVTEIEDAIRRDGSITVKQPDVWGDTSLTHFIQEYDREMAKSVDAFEATLQAYIARSDALEVQSSTTLGLAGTEGEVNVIPPNATRTAATATEKAQLQLSVDASKPIEISEADFKKLVDLAQGVKLAGSTNAGVGVEPTELERQKSTYINVNQALRRRNMGGDTARAAGYGLYKFRVPVSVLPGRETHEGYMALASMRARLHIDEANVRNAFPKMFIADLVDAVAPRIRATWDERTQQEKDRDAYVANLKSQLASIEKLNKTLNLESVEKYSELLDAVINKVDSVLACGSQNQSMIDLVAELAFAGDLVADAVGTQCKLAADLNPDRVNCLANSCQLSQIMADNQANGANLLSLIDVEPSQITDALRQIECNKDTANRIAANMKITLEGNGGFLNAPSGASLSQLTVRTREKLLERTLRKPESVVQEKAIAAIDTAPSHSQTPENAADLRGDVDYPIVLINQNTYDVDSVRLVAKRYFDENGHTSAPKMRELREFLTEYFFKVHIALEESKKYVEHADLISTFAEATERGESVDATRIRPLQRGNWRNRMLPEYSSEFVSISWLVASQAGVTDRNMKRLLRDLRRQGKISEESCLESDANTFYFFAYEINPDTTLRLWRTMVEGAFPIHVFALDPQVEEQNSFDVLNRRRELQTALAISVSKGRFGLGQRIAASRALGLDIATIDLNRTIVGFTHGNDTFGWYFRPRVQTPPTESSNIAALARTIWSTGPTERYDLRHRQLEPGVRECEVLVVMPSFVTRVDFDITTNWEKLTKPGVTKRSYEEMIALGARVHQAQNRLCSFCDEQCVRPGDSARLISRVEQLEKMLSLQTHTSSVPYEFGMSGTDLFSRGDKQLRPVLYDYYGLDFVSTEDNNVQEFFVSGRNFHPTLTHVVLGGVESDTMGTDEVEVLSRELIRVRIAGLKEELSGDKFHLRVGTPSGLSNRLDLAAKAAKAAKTPAPAGWQLTVENKMADYCIGCDYRTLIFPAVSSKKLPLNYVPKPLPLKPTTGKIVARFSAADSAGTPIAIAPATDTQPIEIHDAGTHLYVDEQALLNQISILFSSNETGIYPTNIAVPAGVNQIKLTATFYVTFDAWPVSQLVNKLEIEVAVRNNCATASIPAETTSILPEPAAPTSTGAVFAAPGTPTTELNTDPPGSPNGIGGLLPSGW